MESQPAPLLGAVVGLCADQRHASIPVLQPHGDTSPPSRWPAVDHCPGTVPVLAFNCQSDLRGERCRVGAMLGTRSPTMDGDPARYCACLSHPGMTCPLHPCHSSYGLGETNGSGGTQARAEVWSSLLPGLGALAHGGGQLAPRAFPTRWAGTARWI